MTEKEFKNMMEARNKLFNVHVDSSAWSPAMLDESDDDVIAAVALTDYMFFYRGMEVDKAVEEAEILLAGITFYKLAAKKGLSEAEEYCTFKLMDPNIDDEDDEPKVIH